MKKIVWNRLNLFSLLGLISISTVALNSCESEKDTPKPTIETPVEEEIPPLKIEEYYISNLVVNDVANNSTAEDLRITFRGAIKTDSISEYRIVVIKTTEKDQITVENTVALDQNRFHSQTNNRSQFEFTLSADQLDFSGDAISEEINYQIAILTIGTYEGEPVNALSELSETIVIDHDIMVTTLVGNLNGNDAVTIDTDGNIYVSDFGGYTSTGGTGTQVLKITPEGNKSVYIDGLTGPLGSAFDSEGNFFVVNGNNGANGEILKVTPSGNRTTITEISGWPAGIVIDENDNLYVSNYQNSVVHKINSDGELSIFAEDSRLSGGVGIAIDNSGNVVVGNYNNGRILSIDETGNVTELTHITGLSNNFAIGYITILNDVIYASAIGNHKIYKVTLSGEYEVFAGNGSKSTVDGELLDASFNNPNGIGADAINNKLYIVDWGNEKLRAIDLN